MTASRQLRRARLAASAFAFGLGLGALPGWAQEVQSPCCTPAEVAAFASAELGLQQFDDSGAWEQKAHAMSIASGEDTAHHVEVAQAIAAWKPALAAAWWTCRKHIVPFVHYGETHFEPLFAASCTPVKAKYDRAWEAVGYVLAKRAAAADLATIARAGAGGKAP